MYSCQFDQNQAVGSEDKECWLCFFIELQPCDFEF